MKKQLVRLVRQSPALIVAMLALFVALTGTAVATTSALIGSAQIRNNSITGLDVKNRSLRPIDFRGSVRGPRGLRGLPGAAGAAGATGAAGAAGAKGDSGPPGTGNASTAGADHQVSSPVTLAEYSSFTTVASTVLTTTKASSAVLLTAQFTAQSGTNQGDVFAHLRRNAAVLDAGTLYWTNISGGTATGTGSGRDTLSLSTVVTVPAGTHTFDVQGAYYFGGTNITVQAYARRINAVELG